MNSFVLQSKTGEFLFYVYGAFKAALMMVSGNGA